MGASGRIDVTYALMVAHVYIRVLDELLAYEHRMGGCMLMKFAIWAHLRAASV